MRGSEKKGCFMLIIAIGPILFLSVQSRLLWAELICFILGRSFGYFGQTSFVIFVVFRLVLWADPIYAFFGP